MNPSGKGPSRRFQPSTWSERMVPAILVLLVILLAGVVLFVLLSSMGIL